jgi:4-amino-4-deoxy-L-arabinose transferase-like glycosyltransferase
VPPTVLRDRARASVAAHPDTFALGAIVVAAATIRLAFAFRVPVFLLHDSGSYYLPAHDLVHGVGFDLSIRRPPVYPWFLAGTIAAIGEELMAVAFAQHLLGILTAVLVYILGALAFGRLAGLLAGLLTAVDGTLVVSEHYVMPEALLLALLLATFVLVVLGIRRQSRALFLAGGVALGAAVLCKPVAQALIPVLPAVVLLSFRSWRRTIVPAALLFAGVAIVTVPWALRNLAVHGSLTTAGALGQTLVARTAKHDTRFRYYDERLAEQYGDEREVVARQIVQSGIRQRLSDGVIYRRVQDRLGLSDAEANVFMRDLAVDVIASQPAYYVQGTLRMTWQLLVGEVEKLRDDWKTQNARLSRDEWEARIEHLLSRPSAIHHNELERAAGIVGLYQPAAFGPLLPGLALLGAVAALITPTWRPGLVAALAALALLGISAALDGPVPRYRYPADPLIALSAMAGLVWIIASARAWAGRLRGRRAGETAPRLTSGPDAARPAGAALPTIDRAAKRA